MTSSWSKEHFKSDKILKIFEIFGKFYIFVKFFGKFCIFVNFFGKFCIFGKILHFWKNFAFLEKFGKFSKIWQILEKLW